MIEKYFQKNILRGEYGNNAFGWENRREKYQKNPTLTIPALIHGALSDVRIGKDIVFEEVENGEMISCVGLAHFVRLQDMPPGFPVTTIFDNHNHALYFWIEAWQSGAISEGCELIHIDEHSDLWDNEYALDLERAYDDAGYVWEFVNHRCNVGNYIQPARDAGLITNMIRIENEHQFDAFMNYTPPKNSILNIDIDIFAPELDHIPEEKKLSLIKNLLPRVSCVTIATSPFFIEP